MNERLSRRTALLAIGTAGALASVPVVAHVQSPQNAAIDRTAWETALSEYHAAKAAVDAFDPIYGRIFDRWNADRPLMDGLPWTEFPFENRDHVARQMNLEKRWAMFLDGEGKWWWAPGREEARKAEYRAALDAIADFRRKEAEHEVSSGMAEADATSEKLQDRLDEAVSALLDLPAPDLPALLWKMEYLWLGDEEASWSKEAVSPVLADARRLLSTGRA